MTKREFSYQFFIISGNYLIKEAKNITCLGKSNDENLSKQVERSNFFSCAGNRQKNLLFTHVEKSYHDRNLGSKCYNRGLLWSALIFVCLKQLSLFCPDDGRMCLTCTKKTNGFCSSSLREKIVAPWLKVFFPSSTTWTKKLRDNWNSFERISVKIYYVAYISRASRIDFFHVTT